MAEPFLNDLGMKPGGEKPRRATVAQAVESDAREFGLGQEPRKVFADLRAPKRQI